MGQTERLNVEFNMTEWTERGYSSMAVQWDRNMHPVGVWVRYGPKTSHKLAFSYLMQGMWEAMQDPDGNDISQTHRGTTEFPPYWEDKPWDDQRSS